MLAKDKSRQPALEDLSLKDFKLAEQRGISAKQLDEAVTIFNDRKGWVVLRSQAASLDPAKVPDGNIVITRNFHHRSFDGGTLVPTLPPTNKEYKLAPEALRDSFDFLFKLNRQEQRNLGMEISKDLSEQRIESLTIGKYYDSLKIVE